MEKGLGQLSAIPQVGGAFICDNRGEVIASSSPAVLATVAMKVMGRSVGRILASLEQAGQEVTRLEFTYTTWRLLAVDMSDAILFLVCHPAADMSFVRMNVDVVLASWRQDPEVRRRLQERRAARRELVSSANLERESLAPARALRADTG